MIKRIGIMLVGVVCMILTVGCSQSTQRVQSNPVESVANDQDAGDQGAPGNTQQEEDLLGSGLMVAGLQDGERLCIDETCFTVEVADTPETRARGLMGRTGLAEQAGMIFVFEGPGAWQFWMKDTLIPLDMLWLNKQGEIVFIQENVPPCEEDPLNIVGNCPSYGPLNGYKARYVVEFVSGTVQTYSLDLGERFVVQ